MRIDDLMTDPRAYGFPSSHRAMHPFFGSSDPPRGHVFGSIYLTEKRLAPIFDAEDEAALTVLATQAGVAIENRATLRVDIAAPGEAAPSRGVRRPGADCDRAARRVIQSLRAVGNELGEGEPSGKLDKDLIYVTR